MKKKSPSRFVSKFVLATVFLAVGPLAGSMQVVGGPLQKHTIVEKRGFMAQMLGKLERIVNGCHHLTLDKEAIDRALAGLAVTRPELVRNYLPDYEAGQMAMERIFILQDRMIVCAAAKDVFGPRGSLYPGFLIVK